MVDPVSTGKWQFQMHDIQILAQCEFYPPLIEYFAERWQNIPANFGHIGAHVIVFLCLHLNFQSVGEREFLLGQTFEHLKGRLEGTPKTSQELRNKWKQL